MAFSAHMLEERRGWGSDLDVLVEFEETAELSLLDLVRLENF